MVLLARESKCKTLREQITRNTSNNSARFIAVARSGKVLPEIYKNRGAERAEKAVSKYS